MLTDALILIQRIIDSDYDTQLIKNTLIKFKNANQLEIMALMEIILQQISSTFNYQKEAEYLELLKELQYLVQNKFTTLGAPSANTNNFLEYKTKCNSQKKGILLLNYQGKIILSDQISRDIIELNSKCDLKQKTFFSLISQASQQKLEEMVQKRCLLSNGKSMDSFKIAIRSDRNRKKTLKYLNQIASNSKKVNKIKAESIIQIDKLKDSKAMEKTQMLIAKCLKQFYMLTINQLYLKSIEVTIYQAAFQFDEEFKTQFSNSDDIILSNLDSLDNKNANQLAICEVKEIDEQLKFTEEELLLDDQIKKHEGILSIIILDKWNKRVKKLKCQKSN